MQDLKSYIKEHAVKIWTDCSYGLGAYAGAGGTLYLVQVDHALVRLAEEHKRFTDAADLRPYLYTLVFIKQTDYGDWWMENTATGLAEELRGVIAEIDYEASRGIREY